MKTDEIDFPPVPETTGLFDGIYWDNSYWLLPVGLEYHFRSNSGLYPFLGAGWAMKFNTINLVNYEFHAVDGKFEEYKIRKTFNKSVYLNNYWVKTGLNYDFSYKLGSSFEASYLFGNSASDFKFLKMRAFVFTFNTHYRF